MLELESVELAAVPEEDPAELEAADVALAGRVDSAASVVYVADNPVTLMHTEGGAMVPAMKLTAAHYPLSEEEQMLGL